MRGAPFTESNFSRGLNVLDSPYSLQAGEARDCLNVISTPRGAIRKRNGSRLFASSAVGAFPTGGAVTDTMTRTENPLSNTGKWSTPEVNSIQSTIAGRGSDRGTEWINVNFTEAEEEGFISKPSESCAARWNVAEQTNPAVDVTWTFNGAVGYLYTCLDASGKNGYGLRVYQNKLGEEPLWTLFKIVAGTATVLTEVQHEAGEGAGLGVREGKVSAFVKSGGVFSLVLLAADATYTKGYSGFGGDGRLFVAKKPQKINVDNFRIQEMAAPLASTTLKTIAAVVVGETPYLIVAGGGKIWSVDTGGTFSEIGKNGDAVGAITNDRWSVVTANASTRVAGGPVYLSNGVDPPRTWKGTAKTTATIAWTGKPEGEFVETPKAKYMVFIGNRIFAACISGDTSAMRWSGFAAAGAEGKKPDPTNWPKENVVWLDKDDGSPITGIGISGNYLLVFKKHKSYLVYNLDEGENRRLSDSVGCISHRSIAETPQGTFFLTPDQGVFTTNGSTLKEVSRNVRPILQGTDPNTARAAKLSALENAAAAYLNGHYYLSYEAQDGSMKTLDYDTVQQSWWLHDLAGNQWALWEPTTGTAALYVVPNKENSGVVQAWVSNIYQDSGVNYTGAKGLTAYWFTSWEPFFTYVLRHRIQQPNVKKRVRQLFLNGSGSIIPLVAKNFKESYNEEPGTVENLDAASPKKPIELTDTPNWGEGETEWGGLGSWEEEQEVGAARLYSLGVARVWSVGFGNNSKLPFEIDSYQYTVQFRKS